MFPLQNRKLIRGWQAHINAGLGGGADYVADYIPFYIPFDGQVQTYTGVQGGKWLRLIRSNGDKIELAHLSQYAITSGNAIAGQLGGKTGNTGQVTTGAHLHIQIINKQGQRLDPEKYDWNPMPIQMPATMVANNLTYFSVPQDIITVQNNMKLYTRDRVNLTIDLKTSSFTNVPFVTTEYPSGVTTLSFNWYNQNVMPLVTGQVAIFVMNMADWHASSTGQTYGVSNEICKIGMGVDPNLFPAQVFHELCHAIFCFTGQRDYYQVNGVDHWVVHDYLFQATPDYYGLLDTVDYQKLSSVLGTQGTTMLLYKFDDSLTQYVLADDATLIGVTASGLTKVLKGRPQKLVTLPASQKTNFVICEGVIN